MGFLEELKPIEEGLSYFYRRAQVISSNIANADTPFYRPKDLVFEREFERELHLKKTSPRHIDPAGEGGARFKEITLTDYSGYDGNRVSVDKELGKLAETAIMARALNEVLKKEVGKLKLVIGGR